ncbi:YbbR-like domain-containing protein [Salinimicrobium gaetbulicola]|uniref:YbbR-like domain-containing protein n=1 Tax=Salinimicrobium gaetbulicola TaxID=999702 RepID=A0ABW3IDK1_9FLAO
MLKRLKALTKTRFKKTNFNSFFFFLFFAVVIWIFVQFSKQYNEIIDIPVSYVNIPPDKLLSPDNPSVLKLRMEENGFKIAWFSLFPPTLYIDVSKSVEQDGKLLYFIDENRNEILSQLNIDFEDSQFVKDVLSIQFQQKEEKILPVISNIEVNFAAGYSSIETLSIQPDSVTVSGPRKLLDTLTRLTTRDLKLQKVNDDLDGSIEIDTSGLKDLTIYTPEVEYMLDVEKFTEGSVDVPIELINVPEGLNVVIFPKQTLLFFQVVLNDYSKVNASDFRVVADFSKLQGNQDFLIPEISKKPAFTTNHRLNEKRIQFIIKK